MKGKRLNPGQLRSLPAGMHSDGGGLNFRVKENGARSWVQRVTVYGVRHNIGLGGFPAVSLSEARAAAAANTVIIQQGGNPLEEARKEKATAQKGRKSASEIPTFEQVATEFHALRAPTWRSQQHVGEWLQSLRQHAFPIIGNKPVDEITSADIMKILTPIWTSINPTARHIRNRIESTLDFAIANNHRKEANPAGRFLLKALPKVSTAQEHHPALHHSQVSQALKDIRKTGNETTRLAVEFLVFTAVRSNEVREAVWTEIDWDSRVWTIPASRMKSGREHRIPLSNQAMEVLRAAWEIRGKEDGLIFPSAREDGKVMTPSALVRILRRSGIDTSIHGFRSSFRDWAAECSGASWEVAELCLAHIVGNHTARAYHRTDYLEERTTVMQQWADYIAG